jgi:hypothetical protein
MSSTSLERLQKAAKIIESEGINGYSSVVLHYGNEVANTLLVAHLRRDMGSMESHKSDPAIDGKVQKFLESQNIYL